MSKKLYLQWADFKDNISSAIGELRDDKEFTDVTLVCEDGQQMEAHKIIMASSSSVFGRLLQKSKRSSPNIPQRVSVKRFSLNSWLSLLWRGICLPRGLEFLPCCCWGDQFEGCRWSNAQEGLRSHIRTHIETNHLEGISFPCEYCGKTHSSRISLNLHKFRFQK